MPARSISAWRQRVRNCVRNRLRCGVVVALLAAPLQVAAQTTVTIDASRPGAVISRTVIGTNMGVWFDPTLPGLTTGLGAVGIQAMRWPGGQMSDLYHWQANTTCPGGSASPNATFDNFMQAVVMPLHLDLAVTLNYGTNAGCTGGGDPREAAAWVAYAKKKGYKVSHWTVGNENYGAWEPDMHALQHDPATYAAAVSAGYYPAIKAVDPTAQVGVVVDANSIFGTKNWDRIVLTNARYDFVEFHWYAQGAGQESDSYLLQSAPGALTAAINIIKQELASAGHANTPIMLGEMSSVVGDHNKQMMSITQALFAGQVLGELMNAGVTRAHWYTGYGDCYDNNGTTDNYSPSLYGWQNFGGFEILSDGLPSNYCVAESVPRGTLFPTAQAIKLMSLVALDGEHMLATTVGGTDAGDIRAYGMTNNGGMAVVLFNLNQTATHQVSVSVPVARPRLSPVSTVTVSSYDRAAYDQSSGNFWTGSTSTTYKASATYVPLNLTPWSMTVVQIRGAGN